jgi:hypothetical protein
MNDRLPAVDANMSLGSEVPPLALLGLMHLRVALPGGIFRRAGRSNDGRIRDGTRGDADALAFQVAVHRVQRLPAQIVLSQQVAEAKNGGLIRCRRHAKVNSGEAKHRRLIESFLHARVRMVEPLLKKIRPLHDRQTHRLPALARLGIMRLGKRQQLPPRHHPFHVVEEKLPLTLPAIPGKTRLR